MKPQIEAWLTAAKKGIECNTARPEPCAFMQKTLRWTQGPKYFKVIVDSVNGGSGAAYCFIDLDGNIFKPASFKSPAKGIRGNIATVDPSKLDASGGWLYRH